MGCTNPCAMHCLVFIVPRLAQWLSGISLGDRADYANFVGFGGLVPLLPHLCQLSVPEVGVCGVYLETP